MKRLELPPENGRHFYRIYKNEDGTVDVYLTPDVMPFRTREVPIRVLVVKNVVPFEGIESDIRARFEDWCESAEVIYL